MLFFDTSAAIAWLHGDLKLKNEIGDESVVISVITVYELLWVSKRRSRKDVEAAEMLIEACTVLPVSADIARRAAHLKTELIASGKEKEMADLLIAATAEKEGLGFLTSDMDFKDIGKFADIDLHML
jgi:predicted nucleic acid-binding protein